MNEEQALMDSLIDENKSQRHVIKAEILALQNEIHVREALVRSKQQALEWVEEQEILMKAILTKLEK